MPRELDKTIISQLVHLPFSKSLKYKVMGNKYCRKDEGIHLFRKIVERDESDVENRCRYIEVTRTYTLTEPVGLDKFKAYGVAVTNLVSSVMCLWRSFKRQRICERARTIYPIILKFIKRIARSGNQNKGEKAMYHWLLCCPSLSRRLDHEKRAFDYVSFHSWALTTYAGYRPSAHS